MDSLRSQSRSTESPITRIFGGKFRSSLRSPHQRESVTIEDWRSLQLDIQPEDVKTLRDALQHISHPQSVQISIPTRPGAILDATQQVLIDALPPVLILHMKRFLYDTKVGDVVKVGKQVSFSQELDIPSGTSPSPQPSHPSTVDLQISQRSYRPQNGHHKVSSTNCSEVCLIHTYSYKIYRAHASSRSLIPPRPVSIGRALYSRRAAPEPRALRSSTGSLDPHRRRACLGFASRGRVWRAGAGGSSAVSVVL